MSLLTNWGYTLTEVDYLPDLMTAEEYATMTGRNDDASRVTEEIAAACGFCDASHMGHLFRRRFGAPPSVFRAR